MEMSILSIRTNTNCSTSALSRFSILSQTSSSIRSSPLPSWLLIASQISVIPLIVFVLTVYHIPIRIGTYHIAFETCPIQGHRFLLRYENLAWPELFPGLYLVLCPLAPAILLGQYPVHESQLSRE